MNFVEIGIQKTQQALAQAREIQKTLDKDSPFKEQVENDIETLEQELQTLLRKQGDTPQ